MKDTLLILHFIGLGLGLGTSLSLFTLGLVTKDMGQPEKTVFFLRVFALSRNGSIGLAVLILSGLGLMFMRGVTATFVLGGGMFHAKLTLVVILSGLVGYSQVLMKKVKRDKGGPTMGRLPIIGRVNLLITLAIVVLAVLAFH